MPRRKRSRRHKKFYSARDSPSSSQISNGSRQLLGDNVLRDFGDEASLNRTPEAPKKYSPRLLVMDLDSHTSFVSDRHNRNYELRVGHPKLRSLFSSSPVTEQNGTGVSKFHSPDLIAHIATQTVAIGEGLITETPRINHDSLLELDYQMEPLCSPVSGYETPMKRMRPNSTMPVFDVNDTAERIQDLNNLQNEQAEEKVQNCSRTFNSDSLKRLQNFNELILNTSQSVDYDNCDNCEQLQEVEVNDINLQEDVNLGAVHAELSGTEVSFFTPQLYNGKSASTPIENRAGTYPGLIEKNNNVKSVEKKLPNKIEIVKVNMSTSTQLMHIDKGIQTSAHATPVKRKSKDKALSVPVSKRRSYKSLPPAIVYYKAPPKSWQLVRTGSPCKTVVERLGPVDSTTAIEACTRIFSKIKKYHGRYSSKLPEKFFDMCTWLGLTIKKSFFSLYQLYIEQKPADAPYRSINHASCSSCIGCGSQMASLTASIDNLRVEIAHMRQDNRSSNETVSQLHSELDLIKRQLLGELKKELNDIKDRIASQPLMSPRGVPPPPPPPPPPPVLVPSAPLITNKAKSQAKKQTNENARPIISLNDILNVKLRKTCERSTPARRATDPLISSSLKLKLRQTSRPQTPSSATPSSPSSLSNSPRSSLTRILNTVDTNVRRVKRLQRQGAYSFDNFSRISPLARRDRENC